VFAGPYEIAAAVACLKAGGVVAFPTETVYGLGADALSERAVARVFELKGRPTNNPLIVHVASPAMARGIVAPGSWSREADTLAKAFWPGPLSIVLPKAAAVPSNVTGGGPNVAVRCPDHPTTLALLEAFGGPLVGPSANPSGRVSPTTAAHVREAFGQADVLVLDGGPCRGGIESTVVSLVGRPRMLRLGLIGAAEIGRVIGTRVEAPAVSEKPPTGLASSRASGANMPLESPGQLASHYAPRARTAVAATEEISKAVATSRGAVVISWSGAEQGESRRVIRLPSDAAEYAAGLYAALREADSCDPALIVVERPPHGKDEREQAIWSAVMDRLARASAPRT
jgi:L-threonylcarbamoyladenylate synthase